MVNGLRDTLRKWLDEISAEVEDEKSPLPRYLTRLGELLSEEQEPTDERFEGLEVPEEPETETPETETFALAREGYSDVEDLLHDVDSLQSQLQTHVHARRIDDDVDILFEPEAEDAFWAIVVGATADPTNIQWRYGFIEVWKTGTGYGTGKWTSRDESRQSTETSEGAAYNMAENMNGADGIVGSGVDSDNLDTDEFTFEVKPIPTNALVRIRQVQVSYTDDDGNAQTTTENWITEVGFTNAVDGECDTE